ncbi:MAG: phage tail tube protein [Oscillospiraceae bacterium]
MAGQLRGNQTLSGTWGEVWIDGEKIYELSKIDVKVSANREDVQIGLSVDSKMTSLKGEITIGIKKVYSRAAKILEDWKNGNDKRCQIITKLADPDATGAQQERYAINNVWWNELPIVTMEIGGKIEEEFSGGFTPTDMFVLDRINT